MKRHSVASRKYDSSSPIRDEGTRIRLPVRLTKVMTLDATSATNARAVRPEKGSVVSHNSQICGEPIGTKTSNWSKDLHHIWCILHAMNKDEKPCPLGDVITVGPDLGGGVHPAVRHDANHEVSFGTLRILKEGQPITSEAVLLEKNGNSNNYRVVGEVPTPNNPRESSGPAMVASDAYRSGWDNIFGKKQVVGQS